jgi:hypothetical protein
MTLQVWRRGCSNGRSEYIDNASLNAEHGQADLRFYEERGFGESEYRLDIGPEHFRDLIEAMLLANADEAIKAIGSVLKDGIPAPLPEKKGRTILARRKPTPEERIY